MLPSLLVERSIFTIDVNEIPLPNLPGSHIVVMSYRSILFEQHGVKGTLYQIGDHIPLEDGTVVEATCFLSVERESPPQFY